MEEYQYREIWKPLVGYENSHEVSSYGNVRSIDRVVKEHRNGKIFEKRIKGKLLSFIESDQGYLSVGISNNGIDKNYLVHHLVALTFLGPCPKGYQVNHIDGRKKNNRYTNLEYVLPSDNINHGINSGLITNTVQIESMKNALKGKGVRVRCLETGDTFNTMTEAAEYFNISLCSVSESAKDGKSHSGYTFQKIDKPIQPIDIIPVDSYRARKHYSCPVRCIENGIVYSSRAEAARRLKISASSINDSLRDGRPHRGYTFQNVSYSQYVESL